MGRCCVPVCLSYRKRKKVSLHKFPRESYLSRKWHQAIGLTEQAQQSNLLVCDEHFANEDFQKTSLDSNSSRAKKRSPLKRKKLLPQAIPLVIPTISNENMKEPPHPDYIENLSDLKCKFPSSAHQFHNVCLCDDTQNNSIWFLFFQFLNNSVPKVSYSLNVFPNLTFTAFYGSEIVPVQQFASVMKCSKLLVSLSDF